LLRLPLTTDTVRGPHRAHERVRHREKDAEVEALKRETAKEIKDLAKELEDLKAANTKQVEELKAANAKQIEELKALLLQRPPSGS